MPEGYKVYTGVAKVGDAKTDVHAPKSNALRRPSLTHSHQSRLCHSRRPTTKPDPRRSKDRTHWATGQQGTLRWFTLTNAVVSTRKY